MSLDHYITLGRSGLRVSPLCLGTMTFGEDLGWGSSVEESQQIMDRYTELGGNFIDTAILAAQLGYAHTDRRNDVGAARPRAAWINAQPGVTSTIIGARRLSQLEDNVKALALTITKDEIGLSGPPRQ